MPTTPVRARFFRGCAVAGGLAFVVSTWASSAISPIAVAQSAGEVPAFEVDAAWPKPLPNNWAVGPVSGIAADRRDHIWIIHRGEAVKEAGRVPAPPVIEFDAAGNVVQAWGGPGAGYDWPQQVHGITVDAKDRVWITGNGERDAHVLAFTREGTFLRQIGRSGKSGGSNDTNNVARATQTRVDLQNNEIYVSDGEQNQNHRVIVFDAETGAYKRHWGAYGGRPDDAAAAAPRDPAGPPSRQFGDAVHCVRIDRDGLVYVCDRSNSRFQIFRKDGRFQKEVFIAKTSAGGGAVTDLDFSPDQKFMYVAESTNQKVWILSRDQHRVLGSFGERGSGAGQFATTVHDLTVDSLGNVYTGEAASAGRVQKFARVPAAAAAARRAQSFDLVVANGRVLDPESGLDGVRHIGVNGGTIAAISEERLTGRANIDASGLVVSPGFIDLHAHGQTPETYRYQARDGVTTALELEVGTGDIDAWYGARKGGALINYGVSVGHIPARMAVLGDPGAFLPTGDGAHRAATPPQIKEIVRRVADGLKKGAVSIGAGFPYTPAATEAELLEVFRVSASRRVPIHVHVRRGAAGVEEALKLAAATKAPLHIVHINSTGTTVTREVLEMIAAARRRGMDVTTEAYPYAAGMTEIQSANLDEYENAPAERVALLEWPRTGERLNRESFQKYRKAGGPVVLHTNTAEMVALAISSPITMIASDAYWEDGTGHPRTTGTYSKVLGRYVRESGALSLMDAIRKMTLMPAQRLERRVRSMQAKGRLRVGADADITIFDAARIIDQSTYREPALPPVGIAHVIVGGVSVVSAGQVVEGVSPGRAVRAN